MSLDVPIPHGLLQPRSCARHLARPITQHKARPPTTPLFVVEQSIDNLLDSQVGDVIHKPHQVSRRTHEQSVIVVLKQLLIVRGILAVGSRQLLELSCTE